MLDTASTPRIAVIFRLPTRCLATDIQGKHSASTEGGFVLEIETKHAYRPSNYPDPLIAWLPGRGSPPLRVHETKEGGRGGGGGGGEMPRKIGAKGWSALLLAYPRLASTTRSCSFCLSVNKRSSMDRSLGPAPPLLLLLLLLLSSSFFTRRLPLSLSLSPFPNAICNSSPYFFEACRRSLPRPTRRGAGGGREKPFLIARVYKLPGTACTRLSRVYARASLRTNRESKLWNLCYDSSSSHHLFPRR